VRLRSRHPDGRTSILWPLAALVLLLGFNLFFTDGFFALHVRDGRLHGSLIDVMDRAAPLVLLGLGMTLVIATAGVDLSVGAVMAVGGAVVVLQLQSAEGGAAASLWLALGTALLAGAAAGLVNGGLVALRIPPIVATLTLMVAGRGVAQLLTGGQILTSGHAGFAWIGNGALLGLPVTIWIVAAAALGVALLARATALGYFLEALGDNALACRHAGLPALQARLVAYGTCGLLAAGAGVLSAADIQAADANNAGLYLELDAILAVVLGGTAITGGRFRLLGTLIAAVLLQSIVTTVLARGVALEHTLIVKAIIIVAVVLVQAPVLGRGLRRLRARRESAAS
jgi:simple sugar transport system permease protein